MQIMEKVGQILLKLMGWRTVGALPEREQYIIMVVPHTSNWDVVIGLCTRFALGVKIHFLAKHQLFFFPLGPILKALGAVSVNRSSSANRVEQTVALFNQQKQLKLAIAPEGTRSAVTRWKEGFYHMACAAHMPIVMIGFDYATKEIRIQDAFWPTEDKNKDFAYFVSFFRTIHGKYPKEIPDYCEKSVTK